MMRTRCPPLLLALLALALLCGGCLRDDQQPMASELEEPYYKQGQQLIKQGRPQEALTSFLKVIAKRKEDAPESFLEAGLIYSETIKDPLTAIYFFKRYLELQPNSRQADLVRPRIVAANREYVRSLLGQFPDNAGERQEMLEQVGRLQRENDLLKTQLSALRGSAASNPPMRVVPAGEIPGHTETALRPPTTANQTANESPITLAPTQAVPVIRSPAIQLQSPPPITSGPSRPPAAKPTPLPTPSGRKHTVQAHETLYQLAQRYYGNAGAAARAQAIYEANRDVMKSPKDLRPGMELRIP